MTSEDVYAEFMKAKARYSGTPYFRHKEFPPGTPDKWIVKKAGAKRASKVFDTKDEATEWIKNAKSTGYRKSLRKGKSLSDDYLNTLEVMARYFTTRWQRVNPARYFDCGFEIYKERYYYAFFTAPVILKLYINKDKHQKRDIQFNKKNIFESAKYIKTFMKDENIPSFVVYCHTVIDNIHLPVKHYLDNKIDGFFLTWLMYSKAVDLSEDEKALIPYVLQNYRMNIDKLRDLNAFLRKLREIL